MIPAHTALIRIPDLAYSTKRTTYDHIGDKEALFQQVCMESLPDVLTTELHVELEGKNRKRSAGRSGKSGFEIRIIQYHNLAGANVYGRVHEISRACTENVSL